MLVERKEKTIFFPIHRDCVMLINLTKNSSKIIKTMNPSMTLTVLHNKDMYAE